VADEPFLRAGAFNHTYLHLFSHTPNTSVRGNEVPQTAAAADGKQAVRPRTALPGQFLSDSHEGVTSLRHRSFLRALPGSGIPHDNQRLDLTKEHDWMPPTAAQTGAAKENKGASASASSSSSASRRAFVAASVSNGCVLCNGVDSARATSACRFIVASMMSLVACGTLPALARHPGTMSVCAPVCLFVP